MLLRNYIKYFKLPALQQAVSYKRLHKLVEQCGLEKRTCDTVAQSAVLVAVCRNAAKKRKTTTRKEVTRSYYDRTNTSILAQLPSNFTPDPLTQRKRIVHVTYETAYDSNDATYDHATHYDYDIHGNVKTLLQDNADLGALNQLASQRFKRMDYTFDLISGNVHRVDYETNKADQWHHAYSYDADNRITAVYTTSATPLVNDPLAMSSLQNEPLLNPTWEKEAAYSYYAHGPLARTVIGEQEVQGLDYVYTLQGWIKAVNSNNLDANNDPGKDGLGLSANHRVAQDVMGYSLHYFNNDYLPIVNGNTTFIADQSNSDMLQNSSDLYNGNIARMVTTITDPNSRAVLPLGNAYGYDQLNRLQKAVSFDQLNGNAWAGGAPAKYQNSFTYDANGNILTQTRNDDNNQVIDELAYFYPQNAANKTVRNRLLYVSDNVDYDALDIDPGMSTSNYSYDQEGRLTQDLQEEIASIEWRVDGKVKRINRIANSTKQNLSFDYDAMGHRIAKHVYTSANVLEKSTYYVLDATGKQIAVYERNIDENTQSVGFQLTERTIYGTTRVGSLNKTMNLLGSAGTASYVQATVNHAIGKRSYELANHLGSVITVVSDKVIPHSNGSTVDYWQADISQSMDYSPFGVKLSGRSLSKNGVTDFVRFGFNSHENDDEIAGKGNHLSWGNFGMDPRLGRRWNIDPQWQRLPGQSPYSVNNNSPIYIYDPDGEFGVFGAILGAAVGAVVEYGSQAISNLAQGKSLKESFVTNIDFADVAISAGEGAIAGSTAGISLFATRSVAGGLRASVDFSSKEGLKTIGGILGGEKKKSDVLKDLSSEVLGYGFSNVLGKLKIDEKIIKSLIKKGDPIGKIIKAQITGQLSQGLVEATGTGLIDGFIHSRNEKNPFRKFENLDKKYIDLPEIFIIAKKTTSGIIFDSTEAEKKLETESKKERNE